MCRIVPDSNLRRHRHARWFCLSGLYLASPLATGPGPRFDANALGVVAPLVVWLSLPLQNSRKRIRTRDVPPSLSLPLVNRPRDLFGGTWPGPKGAWIPAAFLSFYLVSFILSRFINNSCSWDGAYLIPTSYERPNPNSFFWITTIQLGLFWKRSIIGVGCSPP